MSVGRAIVAIIACVVILPSSLAAQSARKAGTGSTKVGSTRSIKTATITMTGVRPRTVTTSAVQMTGVRFTQKTLSTQTVQMTGTRFVQKSVSTQPIEMTGIR